MFPCKECLIKPCCSEYCNKLESSVRVIDIHIVSLKQCPDCSASINQGSSINKTTKICFECSKVFEQETFPKQKSNIPFLFSRNNPVLNQAAQIIASTGRILSVPAHPDTMEESHDVFYNRKQKDESDYMIRRFSILIRAELMSKGRNFKAQIKIPKRFKKYQTVSGAPRLTLSPLKKIIIP